MRRVLLLDVGGVVFRSAWELLDDYERWSGLAPGALPWRGRFDPDRDQPWRDYLAGHMIERAYWERFSTLCEAAGARLDDFGAVMPAIFMSGCGTVIRPEITQLIKAVRDAGAQYGIFTNDLVHLFGAEWPHSFAEISQADWFIDATSTGALKPAPESFAGAIERVGVPAGDIVFLDDDHLNIEAANDAGMLGVLLDVTDPGPSVDVARRLVTRA